MARTAMSVLLLLLLASGAVANPIIGEWFYVDFDPPNFDHAVQPAPYTMAQGYFVLDVSRSDMNGVSAVSFRVDIQPWPAAEPTFQAYGPLTIQSGDWTEGVTLSLIECQTDTPLPVASFQFLYMGGSHDILILDHPEYPRWLLDCSEPPEIYVYCVYAQGAVGKGNYIWGDCGVNAIEEHTWSSIKAIYRSS